MRGHRHVSLFFFFNDTATTEIYTPSLHDALPIFAHVTASSSFTRAATICGARSYRIRVQALKRSEEHTSELQSQSNLVCRLLLEKQNDTSLPNERTIDTLMGDTVLPVLGRPEPHA